MRNCHKDPLRLAPDMSSRESPEGAARAMPSPRPACTDSYEETASDDLLAELESDFCTPDASRLASSDCCDSKL